MLTVGRTSRYRAALRRRRRGATPQVRGGAPVHRRRWAAAARWVGVVAVLLAVAMGLDAAARKLRDPALFPLRHVQIQGELRNLGREDIEALVAPYLGGGFFALDVTAVHRDFTTHPWVESAAVRRQWPDRLLVEVRERTAFAIWGNDGMVDIHGVRFHPRVVREPGPWPRLAGPEGHEARLVGMFRQATTALATVGLRPVELVRDPRRAWWMRLEGGLELHLGRERFERRLARFVDVYPAVLAPRAGEIAAVDMRYVNGFAVRWRTPPASDDPAG